MVEDNEKKMTKEIFDQFASSDVATWDLSMVKDYDDVFACLCILLYRSLNGQPLLKEVTLSGQTSDGTTLTFKAGQFAGLMVEKAICILLEKARENLVENLKESVPFNTFKVVQAKDNAPSHDCYFVSNNNEIVYRIQIKSVLKKNLNKSANSPFNTKRHIDAAIIVLYENDNKGGVQLNGLRLLFGDNVLDAPVKDKKYGDTTKQVLDCKEIFKRDNPNTYKLGLSESLSLFYKLICQAIDEGEICCSPSGPAYSTPMNTLGMGDVVPAGMNTCGSGDKIDMLFKPAVKQPRPIKRKKLKKKKKLNLLH